jgi:Ribonuclease G/E
MGVILRTAGAERAPIDIKRDYEYLSAPVGFVRELTLRSTRRRWSTRKAT